MAAQGDLFQSIALDGTLGKSRNLDIKTKCSDIECMLSAWFCVLAETWPFTSSVDRVVRGGNRKLVSGSMPPYRYTIRFGDKSGAVIENTVSELGWIKESVPAGAGNRIEVEVTDRANRQVTISRERDVAPKGPPDKKG